MAQDERALPITRAIATRVRHLREAAGLSHGELADRVRRHGPPWSRSTVVKLENYRRESLKAEELLALALELDVPFASLFADPMSIDPVPIADDVHVTPWEALAWMTGCLPIREPRGEGWNRTSPQLRLLHDLYREVSKYRFHHIVWPSTTTSHHESKRDALLRILAVIARFWESSLPVPPLPDEIHEGIGDLLTEQFHDKIAKYQQVTDLRRSSPSGHADPDEQNHQQQAADDLDSIILRQLAVLMRQLLALGMPSPPLPDAVTERALELHVELPSTVSHPAMTPLDSSRAWPKPFPGLPSLPAKDFDGPR